MIDCVKVKPKGCLPNKKTVELRTLSQVRSTRLPFPLLGTPCIWEIVADHKTHKPICYLESAMRKIGFFNIDLK